jgi:hypothetical protein
MVNLQKEYNRKRNNHIDPWADSDIQKVLKNNISFPMNYEPPVLSIA